MVLFTMSSETQEKYVKMECRHCKHDVFMKVVVNELKVSLESTHHGDGYYSNLEAYYDLLLCPVCKEVTLRKHLWDDHLEPEVKYEILYPQFIGAMHDLDSNELYHLPEKVRKAYKAALTVKNIDANAYGVLLGRTLEFVCIDQETVVKNKLYFSPGLFHSKNGL